MTKKVKYKIGTERESSLHLALKLMYAAPGETEVPVEGFVCDAITEGGDIIEVQTGSFAPLKRKVAAWVSGGALRGGKAPAGGVDENARSALEAQGGSPPPKIKIVHPLAVSTRIEVFSMDGVLLRSRKSPKRETEWHLFEALVYAPELILAPNLTIEAVLANVRDTRVQDGKGSWRRKGVSLVDKELVSTEGVLVFKGARDFLRFMPFKKSEEWTRRDFEVKNSIAASLAQKAIYTLRKVGVIAQIGKKGNAFIYRRVM
jgi:hypothetical protein